MTAQSVPAATQGVGTSWVVTQRTGLVVAITLICISLFVVPRFGSASDLVSDLIRMASAMFAAFMLWRSNRSANPAYGKGTKWLMIGAALWATSNLIWMPINHLTDYTDDWIYLGYVAAALSWATAAVIVSIKGRRNLNGGTFFVRDALDSLLIFVGVAMLWTELWQPNTGYRNVTILAAALIAADAVFLAVALRTWVYVGQRYRRQAGAVCGAAAILLVTNTLFVRDLVSDRFNLGNRLDTGWLAVTVMMWLIAGSKPRVYDSNRETANSWALWLQPLLPLMIGVSSLGWQAFSEAGTATTGRIAAWGSAVLGLLVVIRQAIVLRDDTNLNQQLEQSASSMQQLALLDDLTGALNRRAFTAEAATVLADRQDDGGALALLFVDLDNFKGINELLGHPGGDAVLCEIAARLAATAEVDDLVTRFGGDEFVILRPVADDNLDTWAEQVRTVLARPIIVDGVVVRVTSSIGLLRADSSYQTVDSLLADADSAMFRAKRSGRDRIAHFQLVHKVEYDERTDLTGSLRTALKRGAVGAAMGEAPNGPRLEPYFQPLCDLTKDNDPFIGVESLVRLVDPVRGVIGPDRILPLLHLIDARTDVSWIMLQHACAALEKHPELGVISVNLSPSEIEDHRIVERVGSLIEYHRLPPSKLVIEVSEKTIPRPSARRVLEQLNELDVQVALDDFGSGSSSLAQIRELPLGIIKLDPAIVRGGNEHTGVKFLDAVVTLAWSMGMYVIAEGIETASHREMVRSAGAQSGQGFWWARPMPLQQTLAYIASRPTGHPTWGRATWDNDKLTSSSSL